MSTSRLSTRDLRPTTARLEYGRALAALGRLVRPDEAVPLLREAATLLWPCYAEGDYAAVVTNLAALGEEPPQPPPPASRLTTLERQIIARHLAGTTERDIAEEFYLTPQAVRSTIATVHQRLGVTSRSDLRRALRSAQAGPPVPTS